MAEIKRVTSNNLHILGTGLENLIESFSVSHISKLAEDQRSYFFIVSLDDTAVGYALAYKFPSLNNAGDLAYIYNIEVLQSHRRRGIGKQLIEKLLACLKNDGVREVWLGTATDNIAGQALFESTGAEKSEETFHDYTYNLM